MYKSQWDSLFMKNTSSCPRGVKDCPCQYNARSGITTKVMDVTMCCLVINNICPGINVSDVNTIREIRNKLIHANSGHLDQITFNDYWTKVKTALLNLAGHVSPTVYTDTLSMIDELYTRVMNPDELGELRKLIIDEKRIRDLEETVTDNFNQTRTEIAEKVQNIEDKLSQYVNKTQEDMSRLETSFVTQSQGIKEEVLELIDDHGKQIVNHGKQIIERGKQMDKHDIQTDYHGRQIYNLCKQIDDHDTRKDDQTKQFQTQEQKIQSQQKVILDIKHQIKSGNTARGFFRRDKRKIRKLKEALMKISYDLTNSVQLSPLQERGEDELPIELLFASVVIREDHRYEKKGHASSKYSRELSNPADVFAKNRKAVRQIYLLGDAAHGKTTYCLWLLQKWWNAKNKVRIKGQKLHESEKAMGNFDFVFLVQLRYVDPNLASAVDMICDDLFKDNTDCHSDVRFVLSSDKCRSLIILDGLDEWNPNEETRKQLTCQGMPNIRVSSTVSCLFSMRPWVFACISKMVKISHRVIEILGLNEKGIENTITNVLLHYYNLKDDPEKYKEKYYHIKKNLQVESLRSFMKIPLLAVVCIQVLYEGKLVGDSMTSFYAEMLNMLIERTCEKHEIQIERDNSIKIRLPEPLTAHEKIENCLPLLFKLGKVAYDALLFDKTQLVFQKRELEKHVGVRELKFALDVGLISQKEARSLTTKNVSVHFFHKSIQEFLAAIYIVSDKETGGSFCKDLSTVKVILQLSNVIVFVCGLCPSLGSVISNCVVCVTDRDTEICNYRKSTYDGTTVSELYEQQVRWYREFQYGQTDNQVKFHISDVYLKENSDIKTVRVTRELLSNRYVDIRSLWLSYVPTDKGCGITNTDLNDFLCNTHLTRSLVMIYIYGFGTERSIQKIYIPSLKYLNLYDVQILNDESVCPPLLTDMRSLRVLKLYDMNLVDSGLNLFGMTLLRVLWLDNVTINNRGLNLSDLKSLHVLRLSNMNMGDRGLDLSGITSLCELQLACLTIGDRGLDLSDIKSLRVLRLSKVNLGDRGLDLSGMTSLYELRLSYLTLGDRGLKLSDVKSLHVLEISSVDLGNRGLDLSDMTSLYELRLSSVTLSDMGPGISGLKNLVELWLEYVSLGDRGMYLPTDMVHIEKVCLLSINMSAAQWQQFILSVESLQHWMTIELIGTNIDNTSKTMILSSSEFRNYFQHELLEECDLNWLHFYRVCPNLQTKTKFPYTSITSTSVEGTVGKIFDKFFDRP